MTKGVVKMIKIVFVRHGLSEWNKLNQFTGWSDVDLAHEGVEEAKEAGRKIKESGVEFDIAYTSVLIRAIKTNNYILEYSSQLWLPTVKSWRLNERHYGGLQGLNKEETVQKYGHNQVQLWRRSYNVLPPLGKTNTDRRYAHLDWRDIPQAESLKTTLERVLPIWQDEIAPDLLNGKTVLVVAHGNSLRALVKHIENISDTDIVNLEIPTGVPLVYELNNDLSVKNKYYL